MPSIPIPPTPNPKAGDYVEVSIDTTNGGMVKFKGTMLDETNIWLDGDFKVGNDASRQPSYTEKDLVRRAGFNACYSRLWTRDNRTTITSIGKLAKPDDKFLDDLAAFGTTRGSSSIPMSKNELLYIDAGDVVQVRIHHDGYDFFPPAITTFVGTCINKSDILVQRSFLTDIGKTVGVSPPHAHLQDILIRNGIDISTYATITIQNDDIQGRFVQAPDLIAGDTIVATVKRGISTARLEAKAIITDSDGTFIPTLAFKRTTPIGNAFGVSAEYGSDAHKKMTALGLNPNDYYVVVPDKITDILLLRQDQLTTAKPTKEAIDWKDVKIGDTITVFDGTSEFKDAKVIDTDANQLGIIFKGDRGASIRSESYNQIHNEVVAYGLNPENYHYIRVMADRSTITSHEKVKTIPQPTKWANTDIAVLDINGRIQKVFITGYDHETKTIRFINERSATSDRGITSHSPSEMEQGIADALVKSKQIKNPSYGSVAEDKVRILKFDQRDSCAGIIKDGKPCDVKSLTRGDKVSIMRDLSYREGIFIGIENNTGYIVFADDHITPVNSTTVLSHISSKMKALSLDPNTYTKFLSINSSDTLLKTEPTKYSIAKDNLVNPMTVKVGDQITFKYGSETRKAVVLHIGTVPDYSNTLHVAYEDSERRQPWDRDNLMRRKAVHLGLDTSKYSYTSVSLHSTEITQLTTAPTINHADINIGDAIRYVWDGKYIDGIVYNKRPYGDGNMVVIEYAHDDKSVGIPILDATNPQYDHINLSQLPLYNTGILQADGQGLNDNIIGHTPKNKLPFNHFGVKENNMIDQAKLAVGDRVEIEIVKNGKITVRKATVVAKAKNEAIYYHDTSMEAGVILDEPFEDAESSSFEAPTHWHDNMRKIDLPAKSTDKVAWRLYKSGRNTTKITKRLGAYEPPVGANIWQLVHGDRVEIACTRYLGTIKGTIVRESAWAWIILDEGSSIDTEYYLPAQTVIQKAAELGLTATNLNSMPWSMANRISLLGERVSPIPQIASTQAEEKAQEEPVKSGFKDELVDAGWRIVASQTARGARTALVAFLRTQITDDSQFQAINEFLETEFGQALISGLIGYGLTSYVEDERLQRLAKEYRLHALATIGNEILDLMIQNCLPFILDAFSGLPPVRVETASGISESEISAAQLDEATSGG
jgi:hypothetical protein